LVVVDSLDVVFDPFVDMHLAWIDEKFELVGVLLVCLVDHSRVVVVLEEDGQHCHQHNYCHNFVV
jgi:hypothetical protein